MKVSLIFLSSVIVMAISFSECTPQSFCGRALVETLNIFCNDIEFEPYKEAIKNEETVTPKKESSPLSLKHAEPNYQRLTGVVNECCLQPCTISTLLSYC